jgi:hypothetical protein
MSRFRGWFRARNIKKVRHMDVFSNYIHVYLVKDKVLSFGPYSNERRMYKGYRELVKQLQPLKGV